MTVHGYRINEAGKADKNGLMELFSRAFIRTIKRMEWEILNGLMATTIREISKTIENLGKE